MKKINLFILFTSVFILAVTIYAKYQPGETLNPTCAPGEENCTVDTQSNNSLPSGAVMAFNLSSCPDGWILADGSNGTPDLRGAFIRGLKGSENGRDEVRGLGDYQGDAMQLITGTFEARTFRGRTSYIGGVFTQSEIGKDDGWDGWSSHTQRKIKFDNSRVARTANENRPKNIALLYCVKE